MSSCAITEYKNKHNMGDSNVLQFESTLKMVTSPAHTEAVHYNQSIKEEGFDKSVFDIDNNLNTITLLPEVQKEFEYFLEGVRLGEKVEKDVYAAIDDQVLPEDIDSLLPPEVVDIDNAEPLPQLANLEPPVNNNIAPETLGEWKKVLGKRIDILDKLQKEAFKKNLIATANGKLAAMNKLQKIYDSIDLSDPKTVYASAVAEMELLSEYFDKLMSGEMDAEKFLNSDVVERANLAVLFFAAIDKKGKMLKFEEYAENNKPLIFYNQFIKENRANLDSIIELEHMADTLAGKIAAANGKLVDAFLQTDEFYQLHTAEGGKFSKESSQNLILDAITKKQIEIGGTMQGFVGLHHAGIVGQILQNKMNSIRNKETGKTQIAMTRFRNNYEKIARMKVPGTNIPLEALLYGKDKNGVRRNLISKFSSKYNDVLKSNNIFYKAFKEKRGSETYANWMRNEKRNFDYIRPEMLFELQDYLKDHPAFKDFFTASPQEMKDYDNELRNYLGVAYDMYKKDFVSKVKEYVTAYDANSFYSKKDGNLKNPFLFSQHFYSENYDKISTTYSGYFAHKMYSMQIPKIGKEDYINPDFKEIENHPMADTLLQLYADALELADYANPILAKDDVFLNNFGLMQIVDEYGEEAIKQKGLTGQIWHGVISTLRRFRDSFYDKHYDAIRKRKGFTEELKDGGIYNIYKKRQELSDIYYGQSVQELEAQMLERGFDIEVTDAKQSQGTALRRRRRELANSLAQDDINSITKISLAETLHAAVNIAIEKETRAQIEGVYQTLLQYGSGNKNLTNYLESWGLLNIYDESRYKDKTLVGDKELDLQGTVLSSGVGGWFKHMNKTDKLVFKKLNEQFKMYEKGHPFLFSTTGETGKKVTYRKTAEGYNTEYTNEEGNYVRTPITAEDFDSKFLDYYEGKLENLGSRLSVGGVVSGLQKTGSTTMLAFNFRSGAGNRHQGINQNNILASSNLHGLNMQNLETARLFLSGSNVIGKYGKKVKLKETERMKNWETAKLLLDGLGLSQSRMEDLFAASKTTTQKFFSGFSEFGADLSVNNAEWHNQGEILVAMAQNVMLKTNNLDSEGNPIYKPLFDAKKLEWAYLPGTTQLKPEFSNEENTVLWENFDSIIKEDKTESLHTSANFANKVSINIKKTSGNYSNKDVAPIQSSTFGNAAMMFKKYLPENFAAQYGRKSIDLVAGEIEVKGRKLMLFEHAPTFALYTALNFKSLGGWIFGIGSALLGFGAVSTAGLGVVAAGALLPIAIGMARKQIKFSTFKDAQELKILGHFAKEIALRSIAVTPSRLSRGRVSLFKDTLNDMASNNLGMSDYDRGLLSENAQELAQKTHALIMKGLIGLALKGMLLLLSPPPDDADEEKVENWFDALIDVDKAMNALMNYTNQVNSDLGQYTNPMAIYQNFTTSVLWRSIENKIKFSKDINEIINGKQEVGYESSLKLVNTIGLLPNTLYKTASGEKAVFEDERAYVKQDFIDKTLIKNGLKGSEKQFKKEITERREILKPKVQDLYEQILTERNRVNNLGMSDKAIEKEAEKETERFMKRTHKGTDANGSRKKQYEKESYREFVERKFENWDDITKPLEEELESYK